MYINNKVRNSINFQKASYHKLSSYKEVYRRYYFLQDEEKEKAVTAWRNKTEASKKGEILREIHKLKVQ